MPNGIVTLFGYKQMQDGIAVTDGYSLLLMEVQGQHTEDLIFSLIHCQEQDGLQSCMETM